MVTIRHWIQYDNQITFILQKTAKPTLNNFLATQNQLQGSRFVLTCSAIYGVSPIDFRWNKNGVDINSDESHYKIDTINLISILLINNITLHDTGNYTCFAKNAFGFDRQVTFLNVQG